MLRQKLFCTNSSTITFYFTLYSAKSRHNPSSTALVCALYVIVPLIAIKWGSAAIVRKEAKYLVDDNQGRDDRHFVRHTMSKLDHLFVPQTSFDKWKEDK